MENFGTVTNNSISFWVFVCFMAPFLLKGLYELFYLAFPQKETVVNQPITLDDIKQAALQRAAEGDNASRKWVMDNVFAKQKQKKQSVRFLTSKKVMKDALDALIAVKHKKEDAKKVVVRLSKKKKYKTAGELLLDAFKVM